MIYLFTQNGKTCIPFDNNKVLYTNDGKSISLVNEISNTHTVLARYKTEEEYSKAMELFYKRLNLGVTVFQFPKEV